MKTSLTKSQRPTTAKNKISQLSFNVLGPKSQILELDEEASNILKNSTSRIKKTEESYMEELKNTTSLNEQREELNKMLHEENKQFNLLNKQKEKIKNINLIEKQDNDLYIWSSLFSKSRPISAYTISNMKIPENLEENKNEEKTTNKTEKKLKNDNFIFPVALIDEKEEIINDHIKIHKNISAKRKKMEEALKITNNNRRKNNKRFSSTETKNLSHSLNMTQSRLTKDKTTKASATRPQSVYAQRSDSDVFYLDKAFSTYYTQEESEFAAKFILLHPKIKCRKKTLQSTIENTRQSTLIYEQVRKKNKQEASNKNNNTNLKVDNRELHLAGNSKNPIPLLKSIYKQIYPDFQEQPLKSNRHYWVSNKPLGNLEENIDYKQNSRSFRMQELYKNLNIDVHSARNPISSIEVYDSQDPDLKIFSSLNKENENICIDEVAEIGKIDSENASFYNNNIISDTMESNNKLQSLKIASPRIHYSRPKTALISHTQNKIKPVKKPATARPDKHSIGTSISMHRKDKFNPQSNINDEKYPIHKVSLGEHKNHQHESSPKNSIQTMSKNRSLKNYNIFLHTSSKKMKAFVTDNNFKKPKGIFDDLFVVTNVNKELQNEGFTKLNKEDFLPRPNTGMPSLEMKKPRPFSTFYKKTETRASNKKKIVQPQTNLNNVYFNQYIDMQFKYTGPSAKIIY